MPTKRKLPSSAKKMNSGNRTINPRPKTSSSFGSAGKAGGFSTSRTRKASNQYGEGGFSAGGFSFSRRSFVIGAGAVAGVAAVGTVGSKVIGGDSNKQSDFDILSVSQDRVTNLADLSEVSASNYIVTVGNFKLPYGTLCWVNNNSVGACLVPGASASPLNTVRLIFLETGHNPTILSKAVNSSEGFEIVDVRCSEQGLVWVESNLFTQEWRVMTAVLLGGEVTSVVQVDQADNNWATPSIAAVDGRAFWQVCPNNNGNATKERSAVKHAVFGSNNVEVAWTSKRPFATRITPVDGGVVITPRADSTTVYYQLTKLSSSDGTMVDQLTLPASMKPFEATYLASGFSFSFEAIYSYGGGISNLGTYTPIHAANPYNYQDLNWFRFGRTPTAAPSWCGDWFIAKSTRTIVGIHFGSKSFFSIDIVDNTDNYGEYLVSSGTSEYICGLSQIKSTKAGEDNYALLRVYTMIDGTSPGDPFNA